jgi:hypothetical protein
MKMLVLLQTTILIGLVACVSDSPEKTAERNATGSDRDEYGCIGSAGYSWCKRTNQCERPWKIAEQNGFENSSEGFQEYCEKAPE